MLISSRDPREAKTLVRIECGVFLAMTPLQMIVLVLACALHCYWARVREYCEGIDAEEAIGSDVKAMELEEKTKEKHVQWVKTDFEV